MIVQQLKRLLRESSRGAEREESQDESNVDMVLECSADELGAGISSDNEDVEIARAVEKDKVDAPMKEDER